MFVGVGSDDVLAMSFLTFFNSEKPILFPDITYSFYDVWADLFRIPYERPALDEHFHIRKEDYFGENGGIVFPNPNAPTGVVMPLSEVEDIVAHNQDVIVIVDEASSHRKIRESSDRSDIFQVQVYGGNENRFCNGFTETD